MRPSMMILHTSRRTKHIDVKHDLVRDACDARKLEWCMSGRKTSTDLFKPLDIQFSM